MLESSCKIAVVGAGVAGLTAAHILQRKHQVTLFEKNDYLGGHTHTVHVPRGPDAGTPVDTGFIVLNDRNYPTFSRLLAQLGVPVRDSDMSFSYWNQRTGLQYSGSGLNGLFAQRVNLLRPSFWHMIRDVARFFREGWEDLSSGALASLSLGDYLTSKGYGAPFVEEHLLPMGAAIWSTPAPRMREFPARTFLRFFENHGLLTLDDRPQWKTVVGGSHMYVKRIRAGFQGRVLEACPVGSVARNGSGVTVRPLQGEAMQFDAAVIAAHADEALGMLENPTPAEARLLGEWRYTRNDTVLHSDESVLPPNRRARASWNYVREDREREGAVFLTYDMNRLQGLNAHAPLLVTLNRGAAYPPDTVLGRFDYAHPAYSSASLATQADLPQLNGEGGIFFCGSYFGYGFHEDAVKSAVSVARQFGLDLQP